MPSRGGAEHGRSRRSWAQPPGGCPPASPCPALPPRLLLPVAVFDVAIVGFGLSHSFGLSLALLIVRGMADSVSVVIRSTLLQLLTPPDMLGRVSAVNSVFIGSSNELGAFESGVAARLLGAVRAVVLGGVAALAVVGLTARLVPRLRQLGRIA